MKTTYLDRDLYTLEEGDYIDRPWLRDLLVNGGRVEFPLLPGANYLDKDSKICSPYMVATNPQDPNDWVYLKLFPTKEEYMVGKITPWMANQVALRQNEVKE